MRLDLESYEREPLEHEVNSIDWLGLDERQIKEKVWEFADRMQPTRHDSQDDFEHMLWKTNLLIMIISKIKPNVKHEAEEPKEKIMKITEEKIDKFIKTIERDPSGGWRKPIILAYLKGVRDGIDGASFEHVYKNVERINS